MPLTKKGAKIKAAMSKQYGADKGEKVFYASKNAGRISGVEADAKAKDEAADTKAGVKEGSAADKKRDKKKGIKD
jgi:hypothetical protein